MDCGGQNLSENIWFVWSKKSYCGQKVGCLACARTAECARILETEFTTFSDFPPGGTISLHLLKCLQSTFISETEYQYQLPLAQFARFHPVICARSQVEFQLIWANQQTRLDCGAILETVPESSCEARVELGGEGWSRMEKQRNRQGSGSN